MKSLPAPRAICRSGMTVLFYLLVAQAGFAKPPPGDPHPDVNIVGPTTDPMDIRDEGLKQQNEPACAMRPGDGDCIICFYNDYRTVDIFEHQDAWIGMSESCDAGDTWRSRITPGHPTHLAPIGTEFAADPRAIALPGMTIHGFIGGFRDQDIGVLAVQHWLENNQEDGDYNEPTMYSTIADEGTEGRFIDKPEFYFKMATGDPQPTVTLSFDMENPELGTNGTVTRSFPAGTLYAAYAVFTGSQSVKLLVKRSNDLGQTWNNQVKKLTESQNLVTGITMTSLGNTTMAMWRQVQDNNDLDAIYYATTTNDGNKWSKPILLTEICRFDQPSTTQTSPVALATFRTNDFPWLANDGKNIYAFFTERVGGCTTGTPKVFMQYYTPSENGWSSSQPVVNSSLEPDSVPGGQFMPAAFGARGKVQVAWYDTRREDFGFEPELPFVADYIPETGTLINRKVDVYTARITSDQNGDNVQISESVRVNQPRTIRDADDPAGPALEIEASFANAKMYASGFLAFIGDYFAVTAQEFRENGFGGWEENYSPVPGASNLANFFIAYADNRDVRGDVLFDGSGGQNQYTPPANVPGPGGASSVKPEDVDKTVMFADSAEEPGTTKDERRSTEGLGDIYVDPATVCELDMDRTRDANIYGSLIRDQLRLSSPVASRPLSGILRAIPFIARNTNSDPPPPPPAIEPPTGYRLFIATQPGTEFPVHRASFRQQPSVGPFPSAPSLADRIEDVYIERNSAVARTVFMVSPDVGATVDVQIYDGACSTATNDEDGNPTTEFTSACNVLGSITLGGSSTAGPLQQPDYLAIQCEDDPDDCDVAVTELHNPIIENPIIENPIIENPIIENVELSAMELENPIIENPIIENLGFENPIIENPIIENPIIENPIIENPIIENPIIENPIIENTAYADGDLTYADFTTVVRNDGNVTTAYNVDQTVANFMSTADGEPVSQLIVWKQYVTGTSRDCEYRPEARNQVITTINQPNNTLEVTSIEDPFAGDASFILAPGEQGFVTRRLFGTIDELTPVRVSGFTVASQAANCDEFDDIVGPPSPGDQFYACETTIASERELFIFEADSEPPVFVPPPVANDTIPDDPIDANAPGGACVDQAFLGNLFTVTDNESATIAIACANAQGDQICIDANDTGLSAPVGLSPITCTATDETGNSASIDLLLAVEDLDAPFFTSVVTDKTAVADASGTALVELEAGFAGEDQLGVDPSPVIACETDTGLTSNDDIPIGPHTVTCSITDASGNSAEAMYPLQVLDQTAPTFTSTQADIPESAGDDGTVIVTFDTPTAEDNSGQAPNVSCVPASGTVFSMGTTLVTCTAKDAAAPTPNSAQLTFNVTVADNAPPILVLNGENPLSLQVGDTYIEEGSVATDNVDGVVAVTITGVVDTGTPGSYTLTYEAWDVALNLGSATRTVDVSDTGSPTISNVPGTITAEATSDAGAVATYTEPTADDLSSAGASISCAPASGSVFPLGTTPVVCEAADLTGNTSEATFNIVVEDTTPPVLTVSPDPFEAIIQGPVGAVVDYSGAITVIDTVDPTPGYVCTPPSGSSFGAGDTTVSCTSSDASGNTSEPTTFTVNVGYAGGIGIFANKYNVKSGSSDPLTWAWQDESGNNIDTSDVLQLLRIVDCGNPSIVVLDMAGDPGSSGFRFKSDNSWEYNWQTDKMASDGGGPLDSGDYCPKVESALTGDTLLITPRPVTVR